MYSDASGDVISVKYNGTEYFYLRNGQNDIVGLMDGYVILAIAQVIILCSVVIDTDYIAARVVGVELLHLACAAALHLRQVGYRVYLNDEKQGLLFTQTVICILLSE